MISVGTYNILKPDATWHNRRDEVLGNIKNANLDVVALQEVSDAETDREFIKNTLHSMGYSSTQHTEKQGVTAVGVIWKRDKFDLVKTFTGTYTNGAARKRCFSAVDLRDKATNKIIRVASVHLYTAPRDGTEHLGIAQLQTFRKLLESEPGDISRLMIAGDYNADFDRGEDAKVLDILAQKQQGSQYAYNTIEKDSSGRKIQTKGANKIDWIFAGSKSEDAKQAPKVTHRPLQHLHPRASDHFMHAVEVHYEDVPAVERPKAANTQDAPNNELVQKLLNCFTRKTEIVRDDLVSAGIVTRENCNQTTPGWVQQGLLVQHGRGRDTYYTQGPRLNEGAHQNVADPVRVANRAIEHTRTREEQPARERSFKRLLLSFFHTIGEILMAIVKGMGSSRGTKLHHHSHHYRPHKPRPQPEAKHYNTPYNNKPYEVQESETGWFRKDYLG